MGTMYENDAVMIGVFDLDKYSLPGLLVHNKLTGRISLSVEICLDGIPGKRDVSVFYINKKDIIRGRLSNGLFVELHNVKNITPRGQSYPKIVFLAEYVMFSSIDNDSDEYNLFFCEIENGLAWSNLSCKNIDTDFSVKYKCSNRRHVLNWYGATISFSLVRNRDIWSGIKEETYKIDEHLAFRIYSKTKQNLKYFIDIRNKLLALISFAISNNVNIVKQSLGISSDLPQDDISLITNEPYYPIDFDNEVHFKFNQLSYKSKTLSGKLDKLMPVLNLYSSQIKYPQMPAEMVFLNLTQALETLHARFVCNDKGKFISRVKRRYKAHPDYEFIKSLLLSSAQMNRAVNYIIFPSRIYDLLLNNGSKLFRDYFFVDKDFTDSIILTRNYYTHYDEKKEEKALKGDSLKRGISVLEIILEYYICKILGIDIEPNIRVALQRLRNNQE